MKIPESKKILAHIAKHKVPYAMAASADVGAGVVATNVALATNFPGAWTTAAALRAPEETKAASLMNKLAIDWAGMGTRALGWAAKNPMAASAITRGAAGAAVGGISAGMGGGNVMQGAATGAGIGAATSLIPKNTASNFFKNFKPSAQMKLPFQG